MSDFPDSWAWTQQFLAGTLPQLTLPAIAGVAHVITDVNYKMYAASGAVLPIAVSVQVVINGVQYGIVGFTVVGAVSQPDEISWSGKIGVPVGQSVQVQANSVQAAQTAGALAVAGYAV